VSIKVVIILPNQPIFRYYRYLGDPSKEKTREPIEAIEPKPTEYVEFRGKLHPVPYRGLFIEENGLAVIQKIHQNGWVDKHNMLKLWKVPKDERMKICQFWCQVGVLWWRHRLCNYVVLFCFGKLNSFCCIFKWFVWFLGLKTNNFIFRLYIFGVGSYFLFHDSCCLGFAVNFYGFGSDCLNIFSF